MCRACRPHAAFAPVAGEFDEASTDFRGSPQDPKPAPFFGGNYHFAAAELIAAFEKGHPELAGRIDRETIPPACWRKRSREAEPSPSAIKQ